MSHNHEILKEAMLALSSDWAQADRSWKAVLQEWDLKEVYQITTSKFQTCACGHSPIKNICVMNNRITGKFIEIGNVCVQKFGDSRLIAITNNIEKLLKGCTKSINPAMAQVAYKDGVISSWQMQFTEDTCLKRDLSPKQFAQRLRVNRQIIAKYANRHLGKFVAETADAQREYEFNLTRMGVRLPAFQSYVGGGL